MAKLSVIVPIYNVEKYLDKCMESIVNQTFSDLQIILVDDESPDNCPKMCDEWKIKDERVEVIHKKNGGLGYARNSGIQIAKGDYIAFVDSDDFLPLDAFAKLMDYANSESADIVYGNYIRVNEKNEEELVKHNKSKQIIAGEKQIREFLLNSVGMPAKNNNDSIIAISVWKAVFKRNIFTEKEIVFPSERDFVSEDLIFNINYFIHCNKIVLITDFVYYYRYNSNSLTNSLNRKKTFARNVILYKEAKRCLALNFPEEEYLLPSYRLLISRARHAILKTLAATISKRDKLLIINEILDNTDLEDALAHYPIKDFSLLLRLITSAMKEKQILRIRFFALLNRLRKR